MFKNKNFYLPAEDVNDEESTITKLYFNSGDKIKKNDLIYSFETTKAVVDVDSDCAGYIQYFVSEGDVASVGDLVCKISKSKVDKNQQSDEKNNESNIQPTKKAQALANKHGINIDGLGLVGIIKEKDLLPYINSINKENKPDKCLTLDKNNDFISYLLNENSFKKLSSDEKISKYKENGHLIGKNVKIAAGSLLIANKIEIKDNVTIGKNVFIESPVVKIGSNTIIGNNCEFVASQISLGDYNNISNNVFVDISGGRYPDSNLKTGRGCLIAYEVYINVCRQVILGENVALSPKSMIYTHSYWQSILDGYPANFGPVKMMDDTWLGSMSHILPNVKIGEGSTIISNSLVTSDVSPFTMVGGVPAIVVKEKINKNLSKKDKTKKIQQLFFELAEWLSSKDCEVVKENDSLITIKNNNKNKTCLLYNRETEISKNKGYDIVISLEKNEKIIKDALASFIIDEKLFQGNYGKTENMILEFFRRRGIRFYDK